eukprot:COSAG02_NODE_5807_length_4023_cov_4.606014_1_plen_189_part_00
MTEFASAEVKVLVNKDVTLEGGVGALKWVDVPGLNTFDGTKFILETVVSRRTVFVVASSNGVNSSAGLVVSQNVVPWTTPEKMQLIPSNVSAKAVRAADGSLVAQVKVDAVAVYVVLTTTVSGHFEDNAFLLLPPGRLVKFLPIEGQQGGVVEEAVFSEFARSLRVEDVAMHQAHVQRRDNYNYDGMR